MILLTDSGSTKCDWILYENVNDEPIRIKTKGLNPAILTEKDLKKIITENEELSKNKEYPFSVKLLSDGMDKFIGNQILQYSDELKFVPLHFVGSVAYHAQDIIAIALKKKGLKASNFVRTY